MAKTCKCMPKNTIWFVIQAIVYALGAAGIVLGLKGVWDGGLSLNAILWAAGGFLVFTWGKLLKVKTHAGCPMYG